MSRLAFTTTLFALAFLQLVAAVPVANTAAPSDTRPLLDARAGMPDRAGHDRRATLSSNAGSTTSTTQGLLDMVAAVITKLSQAKATKTAGLSTARRSYSAMVAFGASYTGELSDFEDPSER